MTYLPQVPAPRPTRVLLVDRHRMFTQALYGLLAAEPGIQPVGSAGSVGEALDLADRCRPDVVLMDIDLPGRDGIEGTVEMGRRRPEVAVIIVTARDDPVVLAEAFRVGAVGVVLKTRAVEELIRGIRRASSIGGHPNIVAVPRVHGSLRGPAHASRREGPVGLTGREMDVLRELAGGRSTEQIAGSLFISVLTVRSHVKSILAKLGVHSKLEAVTYAIQHGLVDVSRPA
jgi:DNA-binding NarL/FixJ family response regulator